MKPVFRLHGTLVAGTMKENYKRVTIPMQNPDILVVDDDDTLRGSLTDALKEAGFTVSEASEGKEGLAVALAEHPKLLLLDYQMPDMNGADVLTELRKDEWGKTVEVVIATNIYDVNIVNAVLQQNVHDYVLKADVSLEQIVELAKKYVTPRT